MPDQENFAAALEMDRGLAVHLGDQRTVASSEKKLRALASAGTDLGTPWAEKHHRRIGIVGDLSKFLDENRAFCLQAVDDVAVVHDLVGGHRPGRHRW